MTQHRAARQSWLPGSWPHTRILRIVRLYDGGRLGIWQAASRIKRQVLDPEYVRENPDSAADYAAAIVEEWSDG